MSIKIYNKFCYFTSFLINIIDLVNFVNYKVYMNDKNKIKKQEKQFQTEPMDSQIDLNRSGVYLRDDHCDWGSSGMNEFTNEFGKEK